MRNSLRHILKVLTITLGALLLVVILMLTGLSLWLRTDAARQMIFQYGIELLQDKLQTSVKADSIGIELLKGQVRLYGLQVNDREDSLLLRINELHAGIAPHRLLDHQVVITDAELLGADARLWKDSLTSNFKFVIDAFKKKKKDTREVKQKKKAPKMELVVDIDEVTLQQVHVKWDVRHKPRKNLNRPNRGAFDANHLNATLNSMKATVRQPAKGTYDVSLNELSAIDHASGLHVDQLTAKALIDKEKIEVGGVHIQMAHTQVKMEPFIIDLKQKRIPKPFNFTAQVLLQDIAQPFAPVLSKFSTPLQLKTQVSGPLKSLDLSSILIQTPDKHLTLTAKGCLDGLFGKKEGLNLQFRDIDMKATHSMKEQIVMHFAKKMRLKMIRQMKAVGDVRFRGSVDILYKREIFAGRLDTKFGHLTTRFTLDGNTRYMTGYLVTPSMEMGKLMNIDKLGPVKCRIDFNLNISKKTPRPATALPHGRLPMGTIKARVYDAQYSTVNAPEVNIELKSDGSTAKGFLWMPGMMKNMSAQVRYIQTDEEQSVWFSFTHNAQQWLLQESVNLLKEKLQADVEADSINVHLFEGEAKLYGIRVRDRQNNPLFSLDTLHVALNAQELLRHTVHITHIGLHGLQAQLNKDSVDANFRFVTQAFKKKKKAKSASAVDAPKKKKFMQLVIDLQELNVDNMRVKWDVVDKPRKNLGNPKRGAFDANHVDLLVNMQAGFRQTSDGGYAIDLRKMSVKDVASGLNIDDIHTKAVWSKGLLHVDDMQIQMPQSWILTEPFTLNVKEMRFAEPFDIYAHVVLQDIAQPFAPVLAHFSTPIDLQAVIGGNLHEIFVNDIVVHTSDDKMKMTAQGLLSGLTEKKEALNLSFHDIDLRAESETLLQLVMHFAKTVRLKMVRQLKKVGDVHFQGDFDVLYKREEVSGRLGTEFGDVETDFTLDGSTGFMTGHLDASDLHLGKFLNIKHLGAINGHIDFNFNTSTKAPRPATALPNGRLPQGYIEAILRDAKYGIIHAKKIEATINSDGSTATGSIMVPRKFADLIINFNYIQTDEQQHLKVRPKYKFHLPFLRRKTKKSTFLHEEK